MKKRIIIGSNILSGLVILGHFGLWNAIVMFLLVGQLPGTDRSLSPITMILLFVATLVALLVFLALRPINTDRTSAPVVLPKRRYRQL